MPTMLSVYVNDNKILEYDKNTRHPGKQRQYLEGMDLDMDKGIELSGESIATPDKMQRAKYVAMGLLFGFHSGNESIVSATCAYLANRVPELKQIRATEQGEEIMLDLIFN